MIEAANKVTNSPRSYAGKTLTMRGIGTILAAALDNETLASVVDQLEDYEMELDMDGAGPIAANVGDIAEWLGKFHEA